MKRSKYHQELLSAIKADIEGTHCLDDTKRRDLLAKSDEMHVRLWLDWVYYRRAVTVAEDTTTPPGATTLPSDCEP
jgi:hypothetical protein